ncbi:serine protease inhibitor 2-like [Lutzomyia longipalpis]|uniref:Putative serine protease inhibitor 27a n=1 Tax=Lutzomyia longipalpis TaxID=7200 RepID=A0A7G3AXG1_LUTLO|nr:serine protease inhibitor 2-like [Lutzomyia longipalpis]
MKIIFLAAFLLADGIWAAEEPSVEIVTPQSVRRHATPKAQDARVGSESATTAPKPSESMDYWENDDFVPFEGPFKDIGEFDWNLSKIVFEENKGNAILSPLSVKLLMSLLFEASASGTLTQHQLRQATPTIVTHYQSREFYKNIFDGLKKKSNDYTVHFGTRIYVDQFVTPRQRYAAILEKHYLTDLKVEDFSKAKETTQAINSWVSNITNEHIKDLVKEEDVQNSVMLMLNAVYFRGLWRKPFNRTLPLPFHVSADESKTTDFMLTDGLYYFYEAKELDAKILRIPYKGKQYAMTVILPNSKSGIDSFVRQINTVLLHRIKWLMDEVECRVILPKFHFDMTNELKESLVKLGISQIFTSEASLPSLARGQGVQNRLQVSNVIQKAGIIVDEKGSTAYAASEVSLVNKFGDDEFVMFNANHPFLFTIEDETTGAILFTGKVVDPTQ